MNRIPLKYRIALTIFILEAVMMAFVLGQIEEVSHASGKRELSDTEGVVFTLLIDASRFALIRSEYSELEHQFDMLQQNIRVREIVLLNSDNHVVASSNDALVGAISPTFPPGKHSYWSTRKLANAAGHQGALVINFFTADIEKDHELIQRRGWNTALVGMGIIACVSLLMGFILTRRLTLVTEAARQMTAGNLRVRLAIAGEDEIASLGSSFNDMAATIHKSMASLRESERMLAMSQAIGHLGSWRRDLVADTLAWTSETYRIFEWSSDVALDYDAFMRRVHPDDAERLRAAQIAALSDREPLDIEYRIILPGGEIHFVYERGQNIHDAQGRLIAIEGIVLDITERKTTELELRRYARTQAELLREVNHRVKNNLIAVLGILRKERSQARNTKDATELHLLDDLVSRVDSLLTVHRTLSDNRWQPVRLSDLALQVIRGVFKGLAPNCRYILQITPSAVLVDSNIAHHLTLVLNELATNSVKHAMADRDVVTLEIAISTREQQTGTEVTLLYRDDGPGFPDAVLAPEPKRDGIGFDLVRGIVDRSLGGSVRFHNDNGAVATVTFQMEMKTEDEPKLF